MSSGTFELAAIGTDPWTASAPLVLKIAKPNSNDFYYLSYRQPMGYDSALSSTYTKGINIHRYRGTGSANTTHIQTLSDGGVFNDNNNGISFYQVSRAGNNATVQVSFGCAPLPPKVSLAPANLALRPGQKGSFSVSVTNQDSVSCGSGSYELQYDGILQGSVSPAQQTLTAGQTGTANLQADAGSAADGSYKANLIVTDINADKTSTLATATLIIDGTPPNTPEGLSGQSDRKGVIGLTWQAATNALSGVLGYTIHRNGVLLGQTTGTTFADSSTIGGTSYQYSVSAHDAAGNVSPLSSVITVTASGTTSKTTGKPSK